MNCDCPRVEIVCLGEALIDLISMEKGVSLAQTRTFEKAPGGAPANVAVGLARLGVTSGFMGKVGDEDFGHFLARTLADNGVDTSALLFSQEARTALAFVSLKQHGDGSWSARVHVVASISTVFEEMVTCDLYFPLVRRKEITQRAFDVVEYEDVEPDPQESASITRKARKGW